MELSTVNNEVPTAKDASKQATLWPAKVNVFGLGVSVTDYDTAAQTIVNAAKAGESALVTAAAAHSIVEFTGTAQRRKIGNSFALISPDGQPVRWAMNWLQNANLKERVYGPELTLRICEFAARDGVPIFLYGGTLKTVSKLAENFSDKFPGLKIAGIHSPPFRALSVQEDQELVQEIHDSGAKIVLIGLGCPKQDLFAYQHRNSITGVQVCVGAAFDFHSGNKPMAPQWMQRRGLEWLYRLWKEPRRLFRRYLITNSQFTVRFIKSAIFGSIPINNKS